MCRPTGRYFGFLQPLFCSNIKENDFFYLHMELFVIVLKYKTLEN